MPNDYAAPCKPCGHRLFSSQPDNVICLICPNCQQGQVFVFTHPPPPLTEADIRRIIREELASLLSEQAAVTHRRSRRGGMNGGLHSF